MYARLAEFLRCVFTLPPLDPAAYDRLYKVRHIAVGHRVKPRERRRHIVSGQMLYRREQKRKAVIRLHRQKLAGALRRQCQIAMAHGQNHGAFGQLIVAGILFYNTRKVFIRASPVIFALREMAREERASKTPAVSGYILMVFIPGGRFKRRQTAQGLCRREIGAMFSQPLRGTGPCKG